jgi:hypothetical protein
MAITTTGTTTTGLPSTVDMPRTVGTVINTGRSVGTHAVASWSDPFGTVRKLTSM